ncbi:MAG: hypothetical protein OXU20_16765 [Myxococcales bacterium]|nr:hypothetical protein [Myxococcales bacterium]
MFNYTATLSSSTEDLVLATTRGEGTGREVVRGGKVARLYSMSGLRTAGLALDADSTFSLEFEVDPQADSTGRYPVSGHYTMTEQHGRQRKTVRRDYTGYVSSPNAAELTLNVTAPAYDRPDILQELDIVVERELRPVPDLGVDDVIERFVEQIGALESAASKDVRKEFVYLPTSGVFGEAILGRSNGSEYVNPKRFYNWKDSPPPISAPPILAVDLNRKRGGEVADDLQPTVPGGVVEQLPPNQYPMPTSLTDALNAVSSGSMFRDMSKAGELAATLNSLSQLANNAAQLAGSLSGEAASNALDAAVALGQQVAALTGNAMASNVAPAPTTATEKAAALNLLDDISSNPAPEQSVSTNDSAKGDAMGTPLDPCDDEHNGGSNGGGNAGDGEDEGDDNDGQSDGTSSTAATLSGRLSVVAGLPPPYHYARANILEVIDQAIPEDIEEALKEVYQALRDGITGNENEEEKQAAVMAVLTKVKGHNPSAYLLGVLIDVLLSEPTLDLVEGFLALLYDLMYYMLYPYLSFERSGERGNWMKADFAIDKTRDEQPVVRLTSAYPYCTVRYYIGGTPVNNAPNPPSWGVEGLQGAILIASDPAKSVEDLDWRITENNADGLALEIKSEQWVMADINSVLASAIEYGKTRLSEYMQSLTDNGKQAFHELIEAELGDGWAAVLADYVVEGILNLDKLVVWLGAELLSLGLLPFTQLIGEQPLGSTFELVVDISYQEGSPEGWQLDMWGERSRFPALQVEFTGAEDTTTIVAGAAHPQGLFSLVLANEPIQVEPQPIG